MKFFFFSLALLLTQSLIGQQQHPSFQQADSALKQGNYREAIILFEKALEDKDLQQDTRTKELAWVKKGEALYKLQQPDSAIVFLESLEFTNTNAQFHLYQLLGKIYISNKSGYASGMVFYQKASTLIPSLDETTDEEKAQYFYDLTQLSLSMRDMSALQRYLEEYRVFSNSAFPENHYTRANYMQVKGTIMMLQQKPDSALQYLEDSERLLLQANNSGEEVNIYLSDLHKSLAFYYSLKSKLRLQLEHGKKQIHYLEKSPGENIARLASAYSSLALDHQIIGDLNGMDRYVNKAIDLYKSANMDNHHGLGFAYIVKSVVYSFKPNALNQALEILLEALKIYETSYGKGHPETARPLKDIGVAYQKLGQLKKAGEYLNKSLNISKKHNDYERIYSGYFYVAGNQSAMGLFEESRKNFLTGLRILRQKHDENNSWNGRFMEAMGALDLSEKKYTDAEKKLKSAEANFKLNLGNTHPVVAFLYLKMVNLYMQTGESTKALAYADSVVLSNVKIDDVTGETEVVDMVMNTDARDLKAQVLLQLYDSTRDKTLLAKAISLYKSNSESILALVEQSQPGDDLTQYSEEYKAVYSKMIETKLTLLNQAENKASLKEELFSLSEKSRSLILTMRQHQIRTTNRGRESSPFIVEKLRLEDKINYQRGLILTETSEEAKSQLESELIDFNRTLEKFLESSEDINWFNEITGRDFDLPSVQQSLQDDQVVIEYLQLQGEYLLFTITKDSYEVTLIETHEDLEQSILQFYTSLEQNDLEQFKKTSYGLYQALIAPIKGHLKNRVIVVPDGLLWNINFELLISTSGEQQGFKELDYLTKAYSFGYVHTASSLFDAQEIKANSSKGLLAFAYDESPTTEPQLNTMRNSTVANLPGTSNEVNQIAKLLGGKHYFGKAANEKSFKELAANHQVIHLAMHAKSDSLENDRSYLYFTSPDNQVDETEDGLLHIFELYNMRLSADLVVLSACNAGLGELNSAEGNMSFGRAFQHAGAKSVLLSQWEVSDAATPDIMQSFYANLKEGKSKDEALRQAKLSFLENANNISANPIYWGSFFVLGNTDSIEFKSDSFFTRYGMLTLMVLAGVILLFFIRSRVKTT